MTAPRLRPAVFLDRDGTLSEEVGYVNHISRYRVFPYSAAAIRALNDAGFLAVLATNQAGVARGYFPESLVHDVHAALRARIVEGGGRLDGLYVCLHHPTVGDPPYRLDCDCRKPKPGLVLRAAAELGIDLAQSWVVGDRYGDVQLAWNAGARGALVKTGYGLGELERDAASWPQPPDLVADDVFQAVQRIIHDSRGAAA